MVASVFSLAQRTVEPRLQMYTIRVLRDCPSLKILEVKAVSVAGILEEEVE